MTRMQKARIIKLTIGLLIGLIGSILGFIWLGWQFMLVLFLLMWSNNISMDN